MKTTLAAILIATASVAHANLVDITPLGFNPDRGLPQIFNALGKQLYFDTAAHGCFAPPRECYNGWMNQYGVLDGGIYFFTNLFDISPTPSALIWWNFNNSPPGYRLTYILVSGRKPDQSVWMHLYGVRRSEQLISPGNQLVTLDGMTVITGISFYGL
jgi:hypothetical protein